MTTENQAVPQKPPVKLDADSIIARHQAMLNEEVKKNAAEEINSLYEDIEKGGSLRYARRLPLNLFEEHFLPYFSGKVKDEKEISVTLSRWIDVAGHAGTPVDIIDDKGDVLFVIPALRDGTLLDPKKAEALNYALRQYNGHAARSPRAAIGYLLSNKDKIAANLMVDDVNAQRAKRWESFANYYKLGQSVSKDKANNGNDRPAIEDEFEFN